MEATSTKFVPDCIKSNFLHSFIIVQVDMENKPGIYTVSGCYISLCSWTGDGSLGEQGREGYGRGTGDGRRKGRKWERNSKTFDIYYCLSSSQKHKPSNVFLLPFNILQGFKQSFICKKT